MPRSEPHQSRHAISPGGQAGVTRLLVVRHGQSEWNTSGRWQGHADIELDEAGLRQSAAAAAVLGSFDAVWASDLRRAWLTAQIIAELSGVGPVRTDVRLRETDVGPWQGLTGDEVESGWPGYLAGRRRPEGFEPYDDAATRAIAALIEIAADHPGGEVLVISHGGVIRAVRRAVGADSPRLPNLSGSWFVVDNRGLHAGETVHLLESGLDPVLDPGHDDARNATSEVL